MAHIISSKILIKAYNKANIHIEPLFIGLEESLQRSNAGKTDGEFARINKITELYPNLRKVPVPILSVQAIAFSKDPSTTINNWNDLRNYKLMIVKGAKFIETGTQGIDKNYARNLEDALDQLQADKAEVIVIPKLAGINLIYKKRYHDIKAVSNSLKTLKLYHFVHKKNMHLIPIITPILREMEQSGEITFIRKSQLLKAAKQFSVDEK